MAENHHLAQEVGAKIKYLRLKRGLSQESLALSCDMNPAFLGHVERGMRSPTLTTLPRICDADRPAVRHISQWADRRHPACC